MTELSVEVLISVDGFAFGTRSPGVLRVRRPGSAGVDQRARRQTLANPDGPADLTMLNELPNEARDDGWERMVNAPTTVFSRTLDTVEWPGATLCADDAIDEVRRLRDADALTWVPTAAFPWCASCSPPAWSTTCGCSCSRSCSVRPGNNRPCRVHPTWPSTSSATPSSTAASPATTTARPAIHPTPDRSTGWFGAEVRGRPPSAVATIGDAERCGIRTRRGTRLKQAAGAEIGASVQVIGLHRHAGVGVGWGLTASDADQREPSLQTAGCRLSRISRANATQAPQMAMPGPLTSWSTSEAVRPQKEQPCLAGGRRFHQRAGLVGLTVM